MLMNSGRGKDANFLLIAVAVLLALIILALPEPSRNRGADQEILSWAFLARNPVVFLPLLTLVITSSIWWALERQPLIKSVAVQYAPPDLSPAEAGALLDDTVKARAIISTIVDLAVRGYLSIEQSEDDGKSSKDYVFQNLKKPDWAKELAPHECDLMEHIFEYGEQPSLATLWHGLPEYRAQVKEHIFKSLAEKNIYLISPILGGTIILLGGCSVLLLLWLLAIALNIRLTEYNLLNPICFALAMFVIFFFSKKITLKSALGKERWRQVKGFQEFMGRVEADRMKTLSPDIFEKFLPYAIALGVENEWTATFKGMLTRPLGWYTGALADFLSILDE